MATQPMADERLHGLRRIAYGIGLDGGKPARIACRRLHDHPVVQDHAGLHGQQQHREQDRDEERRFHSRLPALACAQNAQSPPPLRI